MDLVGQSLAWAEKSGLPAALVQQRLSGFFANPATREYVAKIGERDFETVGRLPEDRPYDPRATAPRRRPRERSCSPGPASWVWRGSCRSAQAADIGVGEPQLAEVEEPGLMRGKRLDASAHGRLANFPWTSCASTASAAVEPGATAVTA